MPATTFSQEVLRALALGSFPQTDAEKRKSSALVHSALRCRKGRGLSAAQLAMVGNCGGPGSGKPGPCPDPEFSTKAFHGSKLANFDMKYHLAGRGGYRYWTASEEHGRAYAGQKGTLIEGNLKIKNPLDLMAHSGPNDVSGESVEKLLKSKGVDTEGIEFRSNAPMWRQVQADGLKYKLRDAGYDAIVISEKGHDKSYFLFEDDQIYRPKKPTANAFPIRISKLAPYLHDLLGDVTKKQSRVIAQALKRGIDRKWADSTVARLIADKADIDPDRAKVIARTEMRRAKADISLGKKRDSAKVVFTLGNDDACPICRALEGKVFTVRKAAGVIPRHPNCYCFWSDAAKGAKVTRNEVAPTTNDFRDSLLRFSALNQFCATGEGGGVDPSCSSGGKGASAINYALVSKYVNDSKALSDEEKQKLKESISRSSTSKARLERVMTNDPRHSVGDEIDLGPSSFTDVRLTASKGADHISIKYSDDAVYILKDPKRGIDVDYTKVESKNFSAAGEKETVVAGKYRIVGRKSMDHPARSGKLRVYILSEVS